MPYVFNDQVWQAGLTEAEALLSEVIIRKETELRATHSTTKPPRDDVELIATICGRFHSFARQLRKRHNERDAFDIVDEHDVQDALHAILRLFFDDVREEENSPSTAGKAARIDFLLKSESIAIEVKKTRRGLKAKALGDELLIDIGRYRGHPRCRTLVCFIYDPEGFVANPRGLETDLQAAGGDLRVIAIVAPKVE